MNPYEMVALIVALVTFSSVIKVLFRRHAVVEQEVEPETAPLGEQSRLREEVQTLKQRIQVLERIAVDKENSVAREIEQLRDR